MVTASEIIPNFQDAQARARGSRVFPIVLGMHRSGTSLTSGALHRLGVDMIIGPLHTDEHNPGGYFERFAFVDIHDTLLVSLGSRWDASAPLTPGWWREPVAMAARARIIEQLRQQLPQSPRQLWGIKDPRIMRLLPLWLDICAELDLEPRIILATRNPDNVSASLTRRDAMSHDEGLLLWTSYHMEFLHHVGHVPWIQVDYDDWMEDHRAQAARMVRFLDVPVAGSTEAVLASLDSWVNPDWSHGTATKARRSRSFAHWLYDRIREVAVQDASGAADTKSLVNLAEQYQVFTGIFRPLFRQSAQWRISTDQQAREVKDYAARLQELDDKLRDAQVNSQQHLDRLAEVAANAARLTAANTDLSGKLEQANAALVSERRELKSLKSEFENQRKELNQAVSERAAAITANADNLTALQDARAKISGLTSQIAGLTESATDQDAAIASVTSERDAAVAQVAELQRQHAALKEERDQAVRERQDAAAALEGMRQDFDNTRQELTALTTTLIETKNLSQQRLNQITALNDQIDSLTALADDQVALQQKLQDDLDDCRQLAQLRLDNISELSSQVDQLIAGLAEQVTERERGQAELASALSQVQQQTEKSAELSADLARLAEALSEQTAERELAELNLATAQEHEREQVSTILELTGKMDRLGDTLSELSAEREMLAQELATAQEQASDQAGKVTDLRGEVDRLLGIIAEQAAEQDRVVGHLVATEAQVQERDETITNLSAAIERLEAELVAAWTQLEEVQRQVVGLTEDMTTLNISLATVTGERDASQDRLAALSADLAAVEAHASLRREEAARAMQLLLAELDQANRRADAAEDQLMARLRELDAAS